MQDIPKMDLREKISAGQAVVGIVGLGYVGIPLALRFSEVALPVLGFDIDPERVESLNSGRSPIKHIPHEQIACMVGKGFQATDDFSRIGEADVIVICVPTPLSRHREPDLSFVVGTMETIAPHLRAGQLLSLESTTWPGTTAEVLLPYLKERDFSVGAAISAISLLMIALPQLSYFWEGTIGAIADAPSEATIELTSEAPNSFFLLWFTGLPESTEAAGRYRAEISQIELVE
jgi:hypothetical protein